MIYLNSIFKKAMDIAVHRRGFLKGLGVTGAGVLAGCAVPKNVFAKDEYNNVTSPENGYVQWMDELKLGNIKAATHYFNEGVELDMQRRTVDDVLYPYLKFNVINRIYPSRKGDFYNKVYNLGRPCVVFTYDSRTYFYSDVSKRAAIVFKNLAYFIKKFHPDEVNFFVYDVSKAPDYVYRNGKVPGKGKEILDEFKKKGWVFRTTPDMLMYSPFDLVKGETPGNNDGRVELIDVLFDGPGKNGYVLGWLYEQNDERTTINWIKTNITNPNGNYVLRLNNSTNAERVYINK